MKQLGYLFVCFLCTKAVEELLKATISYLLDGER